MRLHTRSAIWFVIDHLAPNSLANLPVLASQVQFYLIKYKLHANENHRFDPASCRVGYL